MKQRRIDATFIIAALALTTLLILTALPQAGTAASRLEQQPSEPLVQFPGTTAGVSAALYSSPVMFIENVGQFDEHARFQVCGGIGTMWLAEDAIWLTIVQRSQVDTLERSDVKHTNVEREDEPFRAENLRLSFPGANPHPRIEPFDRLDTVVSYFIGNDPDQWHPDVPVWGGVRYMDLYPGVDLEITSQNGQWMWRVVTANGATLSQVRLRVDGANTLTLDSDALRLTTSVGDFTMPLLHAIAHDGTPLDLLAIQPQVDDTEIIAPLSSALLFPHSFASLQDNPADLLYSTFLGGSGFEGGYLGQYAVAAKESGPAYVAGTTWSPDFPTTPGAFDTTYSGGLGDIFVVKLNSVGSGLVYATFLGGSDGEESIGITVDGTGNAYVTGGTYSSDFPTTVGAFDRFCGTDGNCDFDGEYGYTDVFVTKLAADGRALLYSTFLGGSSGEDGKDIAVGISGAVFVAGLTWSSDFPTTSAAYDTTFNGYYDAFAAKLAADGSALVYATFLGGYSGEDARALALDPMDEAAYVAGYTRSSNFPTTPGAFDGTCDCGYDYDDAFVVKLNSVGSGLVYATFLGGSGDDIGNALKVDGGGSAYIVGHTRSSNFPTTSGAFDTTFNGGYDAFVAKLNADGSALVYATFLGGSSDDCYDNNNLYLGCALELDGSGQAYIAGFTQSSNFPTTPGAYDTTHNGGSYDAFVVTLNAPGGGLAYATFLGGTDYDYGHAIAVDGSGAAYVAGGTDSANFPTTPGAFDTSHNGASDAFVAKLAVGDGEPAKPPVVLVHGWLGFPGSSGDDCTNTNTPPRVYPGTSRFFRDLPQWLYDLGYTEIYEVKLTTGPGHTPRFEDNAAECLRSQLESVTGGTRKAILIAHSMGGLVSRAYMENQNIYRDNVLRLITLGSPHAGISDGFLFKILLGLVDCEDDPGTCQLSRERVLQFNRDHPRRAPGVLYNLIGGRNWTTDPLGWLLYYSDGPNDNRVGLASATGRLWRVKPGEDKVQVDGQFVDRYQTNETHSGYFRDDPGDARSCLQYLLGGSDTGGSCVQATAAMVQAQAAAIAYTLDMRGHITSTQTVTHTLQVDADGASLFYLSWVTGTLGLTLTNPVGTVIDPAYAAANTDVVTYTTSPGSEMTPPFASYAFTTTVPGFYTATITADNVDITGTDYLLFAAMETTRTLSVALDSDHYQIGDTAVLTATLEGAGGGIIGATVQATFSHSDSITDTLTLTDQGDGTYRGTYTIPNVPGYLHLRVTAEGSDAGTQFNRQVDRLLTVASQAVQLTGTYTDRADDTDGNGRYETLTVDVEVLAAGAGDFTFSADLVAGGDQFVAHVITQTALITGTQSVPISFDGDLIHEGESDGPFTVTNLLISDLQNAGIPSVMADDVWTTAAYDHTQFGRIPGDMNGDCIVTVVDIMLVVSRWNTSIGDIRYDATYDQDGDGDIGIADIMLVAAHWRETCD